MHPQTSQIQQDKRKSFSCRLDLAVNVQTVSLCEVELKPKDLFCLFLHVSPVRRVLGTSAAGGVSKCHLCIAL